MTASSVVQCVCALISSWSRHVTGSPGSQMIVRISCCSIEVTQQAK